MSARQRYWLCQKKRGNSLGYVRVLYRFLKDKINFHHELKLITALSYKHFCTHLTSRRISNSSSYWWNAFMLKSIESIILHIGIFFGGEFKFKLIWKNIWKFLIKFYNIFSNISPTLTSFPKLEAVEHHLIMRTPVVQLLMVAQRKIILHTSGVKWKLSIQITSNANIDITK